MLTGVVAAKGRFSIIVSVRAGVAVPANASAAMPPVIWRLVSLTRSYPLRGAVHFHEDHVPASNAQACLRRHAVHPSTTVATDGQDRKCTRLNSSHVKISYAVFFLIKKTL